MFGFVYVAVISNVIQPKYINLHGVIIPDVCRNYMHCIFMSEQIYSIISEHIVSFLYQRNIYFIFYVTVYKRNMELKPHYYQLFLFFRASVRILLFANSAVNVFVYAGRLKTFRQSIKQDLKCCFRAFINVSRPKLRRTQRMPHRISQTELSYLSSLESNLGVVTSQRYWIDTYMCSPYNGALITTYGILLYPYNFLSLYNLYSWKNHKN